jgi:signal transduction histidine kinase
MEHAERNASVAAAQPLAWLAGVVAWSAVLVPSVIVVFRRSAPGPDEAAYLGAVLLFGAIFVVLAGPWRSPAVGRAPSAWVGAAVASAAAAVMLAHEVGLAAILFILSTALAAHHLSPQLTYGVVAFQTLTTAIAATLATTDLLVIGVQTTAIAAFQLFAATTTTTMIAERRLRRRLGEANAELRATRALLRETSKLAERARISRELHDLVGHHLTALNLHLEVASHLAEGRAVEPVARARAIAKLLLADVRGVVSDLRATGDVDVRGVLTELVTDLPRPRVHVEVDRRIVLDDPERAQVVVRCVQEAITNTIRHSDADNLWVTLRLVGDAVEVVARDDGRGADDLVVGHGLEGMRERVDAVGGRLDLTTAAGAGFSVRAHIPLTPPVGAP